MREKKDWTSIRLYWLQTWMTFNTIPFFLTSGRTFNRLNFHCHAYDTNSLTESFNFTHKNENFNQRQYRRCLRRCVLEASICDPMKMGSGSGMKHVRLMNHYSQFNWFRLTCRHAAATRRHLNSILDTIIKYVCTWNELSNFELFFYTVYNNKKNERENCNVYYAFVFQSFSVQFFYF